MIHLRILILHFYLQINNKHVFLFESLDANFDYTKFHKEDLKLFLELMNRTQFKYKNKYFPENNNVTQNNIQDKNFTVHDDV